MIELEPKQPAAMPRELVLASAGTGKTFRISSRIIGLLAAGAPPDSVFASTFTRKAAGEILDRVLSRVAEAALDDVKASDLAEHAVLEGTSVFGGAREEWLSLLERLTRDLHRVNIGTLDAFFVRAVTSFSDDLGLPPGWSIAEQPTAERVRDQALEALLAEADAGLVIELIRGVAGADASRSVHDAVIRRAEDLFALHYSLDPDAPDPWAAFDGIAADLPPDFDARRTRLADAFDAYPPPTTKAGSPRKNWVRRLQEAAEALRASDWKTFVDSPLCAASREDDGKFDRELLEDDLCDLFGEACDLARVAVARRLATQSHAMGRLAARLADAIQQKQHASGAYGFADLTRLMGGADPLCARDDLYYRLDARTRHILLDEFQDTSLSQWEALEPLMSELLSGHAAERAGVVVADPKQSIYAWRGGEPRLVRHVGSAYTLAAETLATSYRSSDELLQVVNRVFAGLPGNETLDGKPVLQQVAGEWMEDFAPHVSAKPELEGYVRVLVGPADEGRGGARPLLCRRASELVAELHAESPGASIGVLTRTNATVARVMLELRNAGVDASEEGGNPLTDSAAVTSVLALLKLADHPGDRIARYHVAKTPVGAAIGYTDSTSDATARNLAERTRRGLLQDGYGQTLAKLAGRLADHCDARNRRRLGQLVELGFRYDPDATLRATDFIRVVETTRVEDPKTADVRVMTIHKAKGLEFDIVVLPELDASLVPTISPQTMAYRPDAVGRVTRAFPYVKQAERALFPDLHELHAAADQHDAAQFRDGLSGLYVAMTRARHALHILIKPDGKNGMGTACSAARVVRHSLGADQPATEGAVLFEHGNPDWHRRARVKLMDTSAEAKAKKAGAPELALCASTDGGADSSGYAAPGVGGGAVQLRTGGPRLRALPRRAPSDMAGGGSVDLRSLLNLDDSRANDGTIVHAWMERIGWLEDGIPSDVELLSVARALGPAASDGDVEALLTRFRQWLTAPAVRKLLSREAFPPDTIVERELPFVHRREDALIEGFIDRLLVLRQDSRPMGAVVIDYKTDAVQPEDEPALQAKIGYYRPQLDAYRHAVATSFRIPVESVETRLVFLQAGTVVEV